MTRHLATFRDDRDGGTESSYHVRTGSAPWPRQGIFKIPDGSWMVPSATKPGVYYRVRWNSTPKTGIVFRCTCLAGQERGEMGTKTGQPNPCRHVLHVSRAEQADGTKPRPVVPVNISALVD